MLPTGEVQASAHPEDLEQITEEAAAEVTRHHEADLDRIERMRTYAELNTCRREYLLSYFGEQGQSQCGNCDNCMRPEAARTVMQEQLAPPPPDPVQMQRGPKSGHQRFPFALKARVVHKRLGKGVVKDYLGDKIVVLFDSGGTKTLAAAAVTQNSLLESVAD